jgi:hypothetical protein
MLAVQREVSDLKFQLEEQKLSAPAVAAGTQEDEEDEGVSVGELRTIGVKALLSLLEVCKHNLRGGHDILYQMMRRNRNRMWKVPEKFQSYLGRVMQHCEGLANQGIGVLLGLQKGAQVPEPVQQLLRDEFKKAELSNLAKVSNKGVDMESLWIHGVRIVEGVEDEQA